jgi:outer membrane immunogenic protein
MGRYLLFEAFLEMGDTTMRSLLSIWTGLIGLMLGATGVWADGSLKDGPAPVAEARACGTGPFAGLYVGGALGYGKHDADFNDELGGDSVGADDSGFTGGIYSGYNLQCGRFVIGYESDFNFLDTDADWSDCCYETSSEINWFSTYRVRLGFVHETNWLFYVTGGLAVADVDHNFAFPPGDFSDSANDTQFGWTAGGGVEIMRHANWSVRAEGLYVDLGDESEHYELTGCSFGCEARVGFEDEFWVARVGLAYHFGGREEVAPLK